ncbi:FMN-dependent dehydrogenase, partial [Aureobasidium melanogenum]
MDGGTAAVLPVLTIAEIKEHGTKKLPRVYQEYFNHGAADMLTLHDNEAAYNRYKILPRVLRDVSTVDPSTTIWGTKVSMPFGFAPAAMHCLAHPDGEVATSKAAAKYGIAMGLSSWATTSIEDVLSHGLGNPYAMQVTIMKELSISTSTIKRAAKLRYPHLENLDKSLTDSYGKHEQERTFGWAEALGYVRKHCDLPIWIKGVYTPEDVALAISHGANGVIISNHGGRQLDSVPATLDALRICAPAAKGRIPIGVDGGIRRGTDVFKAIALGADFCFAGRLPIWGLAFNGQQGVELVLQIMLDEFKLCMGLTGCKTVAEINRSHLAVLDSNGLLAKL